MFVCPSVYARTISAYFCCLTVDVNLSMYNIIQKFQNNSSSVLYHPSVHTPNLDGGPHLTIRLCCYQQEI